MCAARKTALISDLSMRSDFYILSGKLGILETGKISDIETLFRYGSQNTWSRFVINLRYFTQHIAHQGRL
jgi:hypothetical protein